MLEFTVCGIVVQFFVAVSIAACRHKLLCWEGDTAEHFAWIFCAARCIGALLGGNGIIQYIDDNLCITLQTDNGKLSQGHEEPSVFPSQHQLLVKELADTAGDLCHILAAAIADLLDLGRGHPC